MKKTLLIIVAVLIALVVVYGLFRLRANAPTNSATEDVLTETDQLIDEDSEETAESLLLEFAEAQQTSTFVSSAPEDAIIVSAVPINVVIDFSAPLHASSTLSITHDGKEYGSDDAALDKDQRTLRRAIDTSSPDGLYTIQYKACTAADACEDGRFSFAVDRAEQDFSLDYRTQNEVTVAISDLTFDPADIIIKKGTTVTWRNDEDVVHAIASDPTETRTYFPSMNSKELEKGEAFSFRFDAPGYYSYHCAEHPDAMFGTIIVE